MIYFPFSLHWAAPEKPVTDDSPSAIPARDLRAQRRAQRATKIARRKRVFRLMVSGYSCSQIAEKVRTSVATVRREINRNLTERQAKGAGRFARVEIAPLIKALRLVEAAADLGEVKAIVAYLRVVAALERYHELAAGTPSSRQSKAPPHALPPPPKALTFAISPANDEPATVHEARGATLEAQD
jgi:DNA-binding CsgD family transcriptional regulator